jgi:outer membrane immunogenic protein
MNKTSVILFASAAFIASPAAATNFAGPRAELRGGWDNTSIKVSYDDAVNAFSGHGSKGGFNLGAEVGYDAAVSRTIVAGAYAGIEGATTKDCSPVLGNDNGCVKLGRNFTLGARLGAAVSGNTLLYLKGGYSNGQIRESYNNADDPTQDFDDHANRGGFHFGAGAELAIGMGYVRAEYVRTNYNGYDYSGSNVTATAHGHRDQALLGFGVRF